MKKNLRYLLLLAVHPTLFFISSCLSLDPFLFNGEHLNSYKFDLYDGTRECGDALHFLGPVSPENIHEFSFSSGEDKIAAVLLSSRVEFNTSDTVILYLHGNAHHIDYYWPRVRLLYECGYPVFIIDYRGYGKSSGTPTEQRLFEDGFSALSFLQSNLGNPRVVVYAYSLGSLIGCKIASAPNTSEIISLVLEAPIGSVETLVKDASYLDLPGSYFTTYKGNNAQSIKSVQAPLLWLHGKEDETLALETNGMPIWNNYSGPEGYSLIIEKAAHSNIPSVIGYELYIRYIEDFICGRGEETEAFSKK